MRSALFACVFVAACTPFGADPGTEAGVAAEAGADALDGAVDAGGAPSCKALRATGVTASDYYVVTPPGGQPLEVYCDMTTAGGGWTLVARTVPGGSAAVFGWKQRAGDVRDDGRPFSVDASRLAAFGEILFGARANGKAWDQPLYTRMLPPDLLTTYGTTPTARSGSTAISGCTTRQEEPTMLSLVGLVDRDDHYAFSDKLGTMGGFGLWPEEWDTNGGGGGTCAYDGLLTGKPGMLMVR